MSDNDTLTNMDRQIMETLQGVSKARAAAAAAAGAPAAEPAAEPSPPQAVNLESPPKPIPPTETVTENIALKKLKEAFSLDRVKTIDTTFNGQIFTLRPLSSRHLVWVDTVAISISTTDGEYQANLQIAIAAACVEKINGTKLTELFELKEEGLLAERLAFAKFFDFLYDEVGGDVAKALYTEYNEKIESLLKVTQGLTDIKGSSIKVYVCPKCDKAISHEERKEGYHCHFDGERLKIYKREYDVPLL